MKHDMHDIIFHKSVKVALHERMRHAEMDRVGGAILHASSITDSNGFCPREHVLVSLTDTAPSSQSISTSLRLTFDIGNAVQGILSSYLTDLLWGTWACTHCGHQEHYQSLPDWCTQCGVQEWRYEEPRFTSPVTGISGGVDMVLKFPGHDLMRIVEVKTMEKDRFGDLKAPVASHRLRTMLYLRIISETEFADRIDTQEGSIIYSDKGMGRADDGMLQKYDRYEPTSPFKEYTIKRDDAQLESVIKKAMPIQLFKEKKLMPTGICAGIMDKRAKRCPVKHQCFSSAYPAGQIHD
jgi:hypothetical protein